MSHDIKELNSAIKNLSPTDLLALQSRIQCLLQGGAAQPDADAQLWYDAICTAMKERKLTARAWAVFQRSPEYKIFRDRLTQLQLFRDEVQAQTTKTQRFGFQTFCIILLIEVLERQGIPIGVKTLLLNLHRIPEVVDEAFPGYLEAGLLPWIVQAMKQSTIEEPHQ